MQNGVYLRLFARASHGLRTLGASAERQKVPSVNRHETINPGGMILWKLEVY